MAQEKNALEYDEDDAVKYIQNYLPQELKGKYSDDEINYIIDVVYDFYDNKGLLDENIKDDEVVEFDEEELIEYVLKNTKKDKIKEFTIDDISFIVQGELAYCDSLGIFE